MLESKKANEIYSSITNMYVDSKIMQTILEVIGRELDTSIELTYEVLRQLFPQTADSWGLTIWEQRLGLVTNLNEDIEKRRGKIITKLQSRFPITPERMALIVKNITKIKPIVIENVAPYTILLDFKSNRGYENIYEELYSLVKRIKPSHIAVKYKFEISNNSKSNIYTASILKNAAYYKLS